MTGHRRTRPPTRATATGLGTCLQGRAARGAGWGGWLPPAVSGTRDKRRCRVHRCPREPLGGALSQSAYPAPTGNHGWPLGGPPRPPAPPRLGAVLPGGGPFTHPDPAAQAGPRHVPSMSPPTSPAEGPRARRRPQGRFGVTQPGFAAAWAALPESGPARQRGCSCDSAVADLCDANSSGLVARRRTTHRGRLCFGGPPWRGKGAGKARWPGDQGPCPWLSARGSAPARAPCTLAPGPLSRLRSQR